LRFIVPSYFSDEFNPLFGVWRNAKLNRAGPPDYGSGVESKPFLGSIQHNSASLRFELDVGQFFGAESMKVSAIKFH